MSFKQYFEEKFAFTGSGANAIRGEKWIKAQGDELWTYGFVYNLKDKSVEPHPTESLADLPDEYFITHDIYSITLEKTLPKNSSSPIHEIAKAYPKEIKQEPYFWISFESYDWGSKAISNQSPRSRRPARKILQTVISALDLIVKPQDNVCFSAAESDQSRVSLYMLLARQYAEHVGKKVITKVFKTDDPSSSGEVYFFIQ